MLIDISSPETAIVSTACDSCLPEFPRYDSSRSRYSIASGKARGAGFGWLNAYGNITRDTIEFSGVQVRNQPFVAAKYVDYLKQRHGWGENDHVHGAVGFAPSKADSVHNIPSFFMSMVEGQLLDQNIMSIQLREPCAFRFGSMNYDSFTGDLVRIPLTSHAGRMGLTRDWQAETHALFIGGKMDLKKPLSGYTAHFSTRSSFIFLPGSVVEGLMDLLQFEHLTWPPSVDCGLRNAMPDLTYNLAGQNFTLTSHDYTYEVPTTHSKSRCTSTISPFEAEQHYEVILGSFFLRAFYTVFDLDKNTVGCRSFPSFLLDTKGG